MNNLHSTKDICATISSALLGKKIVLAISGSVAAVNASEVARLLIRHGGDVVTVISESALSLVSTQQLNWATGNNPITKLSGDIEHVFHCGNSSTKADLLLIFPATANTISKIACGIDDTTVTTFATTAIGEGIPTIIIPAMHLSMYNHPILKENIKKLQSIGISVLTPKIEEGKAKALSATEIVTAVIQEISLSSKPSPLANKKVLLTSGRTIEHIDPFRIITNQSSGKMGAALATKFIKNGALVTIISGAYNTTYPTQAKLIDATTTLELSKKCETLLKEAILNGEPYDYFISVAAVADWTPSNVSDKKISTSTKELTITLVPTVKIIDKIKKWSPTTKVVAFRAIDKTTKEAMFENGKNRMEKANADMICINPIGENNKGFNSDFNEFYLLDKNGNSQIISNTTKESCADSIIEFIKKNLL